MNDDLFIRLTQYIKQQNDTQTEVIKREIKSEVQKVKDEVRELKATVEEESRKRIELEHEQEKQIKTNELVQRSLKKNNLIIFGLEYEQSDTVTEVAINAINTLLGLNISVTDCNNIYTIGKTEKSRPILVQFVSFLTKLQVLKSCKKLKHTKVSICEDLTREQREGRRILVKHKRTAIEKGQKAHIKGDFLYINGEKYTVENLGDDELESEEEDLPRPNSAPDTPTPARLQEYQQNQELENNVFTEEPDVQLSKVIKKTAVKTNLARSYGTRKSNKEKEKAQEKTKTAHLSVTKIRNTKQPNLAADTSPSTTCTKETPKK